MGVRRNNSVWVSGLHPIGAGNCRKTTNVFSTWQLHLIISLDCHPKQYSFVSGRLKVIVPNRRAGCYMRVPYTSPTRLLCRRIAHLTRLQLPSMEGRDLLRRERKIVNFPPWNLMRVSLVTSLAFCTPAQEVKK